MNRRSGRLSPVSPPINRRRESGGNTGHGTRRRDSNTGRGTSRRRESGGNPGLGGTDRKGPRRRPLWAKALLAMLKNSRTTAKIAGVFLAVTMVSLLIWSNVHTNALAVYSGGEPVLYIRYSSEITAESVTESTRRRLYSMHGTEVELAAEITLRPANSGTRLSFSEAIETLAHELEYSLIGTAIVLGGRTVAVLPTYEDAHEVFWHLQEPYRQLGVEYTSVDFVEDVRLEPQTADAPATVQEAVALLNRRTPFTEEHIVQHSESLGSIAVFYGTTLSQIYEDNPGFNPQSIIREGDRVIIRGYRPYLSVRTVEDTVTRELIPPELQELENTGMPAGHLLVLEEGQEGEREITTRTTRINGRQLDAPETVSYEIIREMRPRIVEVGVN